MARMAATCPIRSSGLAVRFGVLQGCFSCPQHRFYAADRFANHQLTPKHTSPTMSGLASNTSVGSDLSQRRNVDFLATLLQRYAFFRSALRLLNISAAKLRDG